MWGLGFGDQGLRFRVSGSGLTRYTFSGFGI